MHALAACLRGEIPPSADWLDIVRQANEHLVTPQLHRALDGPIRSRIPDDLCRYLRLVHELNAKRNARLRSQAAEAISVLNAAGVQPTLLKGCVFLLQAAEDDPGGRILSDLDLLLARADLEKGSDALLAAGYRRACGDAGQHAHGKFLRPEDAGAIDLHHRPPGPASLYPEADGELGEPATIDGIGRVRLPSAVGRVTHLIAHDMFNDGGLATGRIQLRHLFDIAGLSRETDIDWASVRARFSSPRLLPAFDTYAISLRRLARIEMPGAGRPGLAGRLQFGRQMAKAGNKRLCYVDDLVVGGIRKWRRERRRAALHAPSAP